MYLRMSVDMVHSNERPCGFSMMTDLKFLILMMMDCRNDTFSSILSALAYIFDSWFAWTLSSVISLDKVHGIDVGMYVMIAKFLVFFFSKTITVCRRMPVFLFHLMCFLLLLAWIAMSHALQHIWKATVHAPSKRLEVSFNKSNELWFLHRAHFYGFDFTIFK